MLRSVYAIGFTSLFCAAIASGPAVAQQEQAVANDHTEVVCRRSPNTTGSRLGRRNICKTKAQWEAEREQYRDELNRVQMISKGFGNE